MSSKRTPNKPKTSNQQPVTVAPIVDAKSSFATICPPFQPLADLVAGGFRDVTARPQVFVTTVEPDALYAAYLAAFPEGFNPVDRKMVRPWQSLT